MGNRKVESIAAMLNNHSILLILILSAVGTILYWKEIVRGLDILKKAYMFELERDRARKKKEDKKIK